MASVWAGGVSLIDTFDYKPSLWKIAGETLLKPPGFLGQLAAYFDVGNAAMPTPFEFNSCGKCGRWISTLFPRIAASVDVKGGSSVGQTDQFGLKAVEHPIHVRDVHATILNLLGLSDQRLTFHHSGRVQKLTDIGERVLTEIIA